MLTLVSKTHYSKLVAGFTKLFASIIHSTVWREDMHVKVVWVTMLAMADRNGRVFSSLPGLADAARVTLPQCQEALARLSAPDEYSRTKEHEGRRISDIDGGWTLLNYLKYREARDTDERRIQTREAVSRHRAKKATVSHGKPRKPKKAQAEAEAEAEAVTDNGSSVSLPVSSEQAVDLGESPEQAPLDQYAAEIFAQIEKQRGDTDRDIQHHTPGDFSQVSYWHKHGIPLRVALTAIESMGQRAKSASYCHPEVVKEWQRVRRMTA